MIRAHLSDWLDKAPTERVGRLTPRHMDVIRLVVDGLNNIEIGKRLGCAPATVQNHMSEIMYRLDLENRTQVAVYAWGRGWVD